MEERTLAQLCKNLTNEDIVTKSSNKMLLSRIVQPEYSKHEIEVKPYLPSEQYPVFVICWNFSEHQELLGALIPYHQQVFCSFPVKAPALTQQHTHDYIELCYVVKGKIRQLLSGNEVIFKEGELCLIDRNCTHQDILEPSSSILLFLGIHNTFFTEIMNVAISKEKIIHFIQEALLKQKEVHQYLHFRPEFSTGEMETALSFLLIELSSPNVGSTHICKGLMKRIFYYLSRDYSFSLTREQQKSRNSLVYESIKEYIGLHYNDISIQDLVNRFHFQEDYFNRLLKDKTGLTYSGYLQEVRMQKATELLLYSDKSIQEITEEIGYHNKGYFYRLFFEKYGKTPHQFRISSDRG